MDRYAINERTISEVVNGGGLLVHGREVRLTGPIG
jgi:hypothetical protein